MARGLHLHRSMFKVAPSPRPAFETVDYGDYIFDGAILQQELPLPLTRRKIRQLPIVVDQDRLVTILRGDADTTMTIEHAGERVPRITQLILEDRKKTRRTRAVRLVATVAIAVGSFALGVRFHDSAPARAVHAISALVNR